MRDERAQVWMSILAGAWLLFAAPGAADCTAKQPGTGSRFEVLEGEVRDRDLNVVWRRCSVGLEWTADKGCTGERGAMSFGEAQLRAREAGRPWRLPTKNELIGLIDRDCEKPAIDTEVFPDVSIDAGEGAEEYWSSSSGGINDMRATVEFYIGYSEIRSPGFPRRARLVRDATSLERRRP